MDWCGCETGRQHCVDVAIARIHIIEWAQRRRGLAPCRSFDLIHQRVAAFAFAGDYGNHGAAQRV